MVKGSARRLCGPPLKLIDVMLSEAKHLVFSSWYWDEIPRLRLGMTSQHSLKRWAGSKGIERFERLERFERERSD